MIILTEDSKKLVDAMTVYVKAKKDKEDLNKTSSFLVLASTSNGISVKIKEFDTEENATTFVETLALDFNANKRAKE